MGNIDGLIDQIAEGKLSPEEAIRQLASTDSPDDESRSAVRKDPRQDSSLVFRIRDFLLERISRCLDHALTDSEGECTFLDYGLDSVGLIDLTQSIEQETGIKLYPTLLFEYQTPMALADYFHSHHSDAFCRKPAILCSLSDVETSQEPGGEPELRENSRNNTDYSSSNFGGTLNQRPPIRDQTENHPQDADPQNMPSSRMRSVVPAEIRISSRRTSSAERMDIAVIGMAGRFPGANSVEEFRKSVLGDTDCITEIPSSRWNIDDWYDPDESAINKTYSKWGGFINDVAAFDPLFFGISPAEALWIDPQLRILLEIIHASFEDAGYGDKMRGTNTGTYIGLSFQDYWTEIARRNLPISSYEYSSSSPSLAVGRLSYTFDLRGPAMPVDNACASSLTAVHLACAAIRRGEVDSAVVGAANLLLSPLHHVYSSRIRSLSPTGRCRSFDAAADGYVPGEGVCALLLKPLEFAKSDGDNIHAIIKGSALNHNGKSANPTAPRPEMQTLVIQSALKDADVAPDTISYIEAQGTGTKLGDPIEIAALKSAFSSVNPRTVRCHIGSTKAHIGHLEGAAGLAGLIKTILCMKSRTIPKMPSFSQLNPYIKLDNSIFQINQQPMHWSVPSNTPRRAGISAFSISGNNAHVIIEEDNPATEFTECRLPNIFCLSAASKPQLIAYAESFLQEKSLYGITKNDSGSNAQANVDLIANTLAGLLGTKVRDIDDRSHFIDDLGLDETLVDQFASEISKATGLPVTRLTLTEHSDLNSLAYFITSRAGGGIADTQTIPGGRPSSHVSLSQILYTVQTGRKQEGTRCAIVVDSISDLEDKLRTFVRGEQNHSIYTNFCEDPATGYYCPLFKDSSGEKMIDALLLSADVHKICRLWVAGVHIPWERFWSAPKPRKISLPTYPYKRDTYWFTSALTDQVSCSGEEDNDSEKCSSEAELVELLQKLKDEDIDIQEVESRANLILNSMPPGATTK